MHSLTAYFSFGSVVEGDEANATSKSHLQRSQMLFFEKSQFVLGYIFAIFQRFIHYTSFSVNYVTNASGFALPSKTISVDELAVQISTPCPWVAMTGRVPYCPPW